jgi:hypothetical protein
MGAIIEDLDDHEGYALWRLGDGSLLSAWSDGVREVSGYVAGCECGWHAQQQHPPTEEGQEAASAQWARDHALAELARQAGRRRQDLGRVLAWLGGQAGRLHDPAAVDRVARGLDRARELLVVVQGDLEREGPEREADSEP